jgi:hypothetical protein
MLYAVVDPADGGLSNPKLPPLLQRQFGGFFLRRSLAKC